MYTGLIESMAVWDRDRVRDPHRQPPRRPGPQIHVCLFFTAHLRTPYVHLRTPYVHRCTPYIISLSKWQCGIGIVFEIPTGNRHVVRGFVPGGASEGPQIDFWKSLICNGARWKSSAFGTNQGN